MSEFILYGLTIITVAITAYGWAILYQLDKIIELLKGKDGGTK